MQVMNNLNLDTVHQNEPTFTTFPSPVTPKEQCFSPVVFDHRREKSDDVLFDDDRSTCNDDSFLLCSPRSIVNDNSFDLPLQDTRRNRSQSQFEPSFWEPEEPSIPSSAESQVDLSQPSEVLKWFTMDVGSFIGVSSIEEEIINRTTSSEIFIIKTIKRTFNYESKY